MIMDVLGIEKAIWKLLIGLVSGIYKLVGYVYQIFLALAETNIFDQTEYQFLVEKVYILLGVLMLFVIAYNILTFIVDPDKNKSGAEVEKLIKKVLVSFILIVMAPTIFSYAFKIQNSILDQHLFENFFSKTGTSTSDDGLKDGGNKMAGSIFEAFFVGIKEDALINSKDNCNPYYDGTCTLADAKKWVKEGYGTKFGGKYRVFKAFAGNLVEDEIDFSWLVSIIAGGYLLYVILSFCFDLAIRVIKLAFYQIIAPICIGCQIIPNKESIFTNWWKAVLKTYISVFIRVFIMNLCIYLLEVITKNRSQLWDKVAEKGDNSIGIQVFAFALLILGLVTFMKQASKLIDEIFGLGDVKLGIKDKLKEGTSPVTSLADKTARVGFGAAGIVRGFQHGHGNPLAAIRAARTNYKNRNLSGNEAELLRRREFEQKLSQGATRGQLFGDYIRNKLGMPSTQTVADRAIEDMEEIHDGNVYKYNKVTDADGRAWLVITDVAGNEVIGSRVEYNEDTDKDKIGQVVKEEDGKPIVCNLTYAVESDPVSGELKLYMQDADGNNIKEIATVNDKNRDIINKLVGQQATFDTKCLTYAVDRDRVTGELKLYIQDATGRKIKEVATVDKKNIDEINELVGQQVAFDTKFKDQLELEHQSNEEQINAYNDTIRRINANLSADAKLFQLQKEADDQAESELRKGEAKTADITGSISSLLRNEFSVSYADDFVLDYSDGFSIEIRKFDESGMPTTEKISISAGNLESVEAAVNAQLSRTDLTEKEKNQIREQFEASKKSIMVGGGLENMQAKVNSIMNDDSISTEIREEVMRKFEEAKHTITVSGTDVSTMRSSLTTALGTAGLSDEIRNELNRQFDSSVFEVTGGYSALEATITELEKRDDISGDAKQVLRRQLTEELKNMKTEYKNRATTVGEDGKIFDAKIASDFEQIKSLIESGTFLDIDGNMLISTEEMTQLISEEGIAGLMKNVKDKYNTLQNATATTVASLENAKTTYEQKNKDIDEVKRLHESTQSAEKRTDGYRASAAASTYVKDNPNETKHGGGSSGSK